MTFKETAHDIDVSPETDSYETTVDLGSINTLHELLALAIGDFEKVIANPKYSINLSDWHAPLANGKCSVCLAGSVMAMHLGTKPDVDRTASVVGDSEFETSEISARMHALNALRRGGIRQARFLLNATDNSSAIDELHRKWSGKVRCSNARTRPQARLLLADLKLMQRDLKAAGL